MCKSVVSQTFFQEFLKFNNSFAQRSAKVTLNAQSMPAPATDMSIPPANAVRACEALIDRNLKEKGTNGAGEGFIKVMLPT